MAIKITVATADDRPSNAGTYAKDAREIFAMATVSPTHAVKVDISEENKSYIPLLKAAIKRLDLGIMVEKIRNTNFVWCEIPEVVPASIPCQCGQADCKYETTEAQEAEAKAAAAAAAAEAVTA